MENNRPARSRIRVRAGEGGPPSVDGHPGWVAQSAKQYCVLCIIVLFVQGFMAGAGPVLSGARSAAWWCVAVGAVVGVLTWIPTWGIMQGEKSCTLDEGFSEAFGPIIGGVLTVVYLLILLFNAILSLRALVSLIRQYMVIGAQETTVSLIIVVFVALSLVRHGERSWARFAWMARIIFILMLVICLGVMLRDAEVDNLFPILGNSMSDTLLQLPVAASGFICVIMLGQLPRQTGSAKPVRFRVGVFCLLIGGLVAVVMVLTTNLCISPRAIDGEWAWGHQLMIAAKYLNNRFFRLVYLCLLVFTLTMATGAGVSASGMMLQGAFKIKSRTWVIVALCVILAASAFIKDERFTRLTIDAMVWRLPIVVIPAWCTWGVLAVKRSRKAVKA